MSQRTQENLRKTGYAPAENRGNLPVICPTYCEECGHIFLGKTCMDKICKKCEDNEEFQREWEAERQEMGRME